MPLWNPHQMGGRPFVANSQSALFSPFNWPSLLLPFWWSLGLAAALKVFCAALGAHLLARALAIRYAGALLAGLVYGFGLFFVVWLSWPLSSVWAWLPWLLLCVWTVVRRPGARPVAALALVVALQFFGGHPESSFHVLAAGSFFALLALSRIERGARLRAIGRLAAGLAAGSLLAAVALLPFLELLARSGDFENREGKTGGHFPVTALVNYVLPEYWGRPSQAPTQAFAFSRAYYAGALPLMLAALGGGRAAAAGSGSRSPRAARWRSRSRSGTPGLFELVTALPGFDHAYNQRLIIVGLLALALLAGWGLGDLLDGVAAPAAAARRRPCCCGWCRSLVALLPGRRQRRRDRRRPGDRVGVRRAGEGDRQGRRPAGRGVAVARAGRARARAAVAARVRPGGRRGLHGARRSGSSRSTCSASGWARTRRSRPSTPSSPSRPALQRLLDARPARFVGLAPPVGPQALAPNVAMRYGLYDARGYDFPIERRYNRLWRTLRDRRRGRLRAADAARRHRPSPALRALGLLGVADIIQPPGEPPLAGLRATYEGPDARIYANPHAMPRAWVVGGQRVVPDDDAQLAAIADAGLRRRGARRSSPSRSTGLAGGAGASAAERADHRATSPTGSSWPRPRRAAGSPCSPTCTTRAGRRRSTGARCRSSASTTCCAGVAVGAGRAPDRHDLRAVELARGLDREPARGARAAGRGDVEGWAPMSFLDRVRSAADPRSLGALVQRSLKHSDRSRGVYPALAELARRYGDAPDLTAARAARVLPERGGRRDRRDPAADRDRRRRVRRVRRRGRHGGQHGLPRAGAGLERRLPGGRRRELRGARAPLLRQPARAHAARGGRARTPSRRCSRSAGVPEEPDVVSIDVDGNDYWIWRALTAFRPRAGDRRVQRRAGPASRRVMPYTPGFRWDGTSAYGASLGALEDLAAEKGYGSCTRSWRASTRSSCARTSPAACRRATPCRAAAANHALMGLGHPEPRSEPGW